MADFHPHLYVFLHRYFHQNMVDTIMANCPEIDRQPLAYVVGDLPFFSHPQWGTTLKRSNTIAIVPQRRDPDDAADADKTPATAKGELDRADFKAVHIISAQEFPLKISSLLIARLQRIVGVSNVVIQYLNQSDSQLSPSLCQALAIKSPVRINPTAASTTTKPAARQKHLSPAEYEDITLSILAQVGDGSTLDIMGPTKRPKPHILKYYDTLRARLYRTHLARLHDYPPSLDYDPALTPAGKSPERIFFRVLTAAESDADYHRLVAQGARPADWIKCLHCGTLERLRAGFRRHVSTRCKQHRVYLAIANRYFELDAS